MLKTKPVIDDEIFESMPDHEIRMFLFLNDYRSDITFIAKCNGKEIIIPGHKAYMQRECSKIEKMGPLVNVKGFEHSCCFSIIRFMYTSENVIDQEVKDGIYDSLMLAKRLGFDKFTETITSCSSMDIISQYWQVVRYANDVHDIQVKETCLKIVDRIGGSMLGKRDVLRSPSELIAEITSRSSFKCKESELFSACVKWADARIPDPDVNGRTLRQKLAPFLHNIRFPCMSKDEFLTTMRLEILNSEELNDMNYVFSDHKGMFVRD